MLSYEKKKDNRQSQGDGDANVTLDEWVES